MKPSIGLGLLEYPVEGSVVLSVVVHWVTREDRRQTRRAYMDAHDRDLRSGPNGERSYQVRITQGVCNARWLVLSLLPSVTMATQRRAGGQPSSKEGTTASSLSPPHPFFLSGSSDHPHAGDHSDSDLSNNNSPRSSVIGPRKQKTHDHQCSALGASQFSADSEDGHSSQPPPSTFAFPFQAYPQSPVAPLIAAALTRSTWCPTQLQ